jgi:hypothetical protein
VAAFSKKYRRYHWMSIPPALRREMFFSRALDVSVFRTESTYLFRWGKSRFRNGTDAMLVIDAHR